jgi:hypothetical protein
MEIRLLAAPVEVPFTGEVNRDCTGLVRAYDPAADREITRSDTAYPEESYTWSASASDDGSFQFVAVPNSRDDRASGWNAFSGLVFGHNAVAQYLLYASLMAPNDARTSAQRLRLAAWRLKTDG